MLASSGERDPSLRSAGDRPERLAVSSHQARSQERLDQAQHALVPDPTTHPVHQGRVVDRVEARLDVGLQHPFIRAGAEVVDLGDRV